MCTGHIGPKIGAEKGPVLSSCQQGLRVDQVVKGPETGLVYWVLANTDGTSKASKHLQIQPNQILG